jgi:hypothetical protein
MASSGNSISTLSESTHCGKYGGPISATFLDRNLINGTCFFGRPLDYPKRSDGMGFKFS